MPLLPLIWMYAGAMAVKQDEVTDGSHGRTFEFWNIWMEASFTPWSAGHAIRVLAVNEFARDTKIRNV
jgi:hypothetical protein